VATLTRFAELIRAHPVRGIGTDAEGGRSRVRLDIEALRTIAQSGYGNLPMYRDLLAAVHAFEDGDREPMFRPSGRPRWCPRRPPCGRSRRRCTWP
jgi:hypothetical protein